MSQSPVAVALAILYQDRKFLMQLRDDIPGILYPGHWGLFGGHLELGETPEEAVCRELAEEINHLPSNLVKFRCYADSRAIRYVFYAPLTVSIDSLILGEGWDFGLLSLETIRRGYCYSPQAGNNQPLGDIHQKILLDFSSWQIS